LVLSDANKIIKTDRGTANDLRIPLNSSHAFPIGTEMIIFQHGAGQTTIAGTAGVTLHSTGGKTKTTGQYSVATLIKVGTDEWVLFGDITT
jgi:hypothetical protein